MITGVSPAPDSPAFADAKLVLRASLIPSLAALPQPRDVTAQVPLTLTPPADARSLFQQLQTMLTIAPEPAGSSPKRSALPRGNICRRATAPRLRSIVPARRSR